MLRARANQLRTHKKKLALLHTINGDARHCKLHMISLLSMNSCAFRAFLFPKLVADWITSKRTKLLQKNYNFVLKYRFLAVFSVTQTQIIINHHQNLCWRVNGNFLLFNFMYIPLKNSLQTCQLKCGIYTTHLVWIQCIFNYVYYHKTAAKCSLYKLQHYSEKEDAKNTPLTLSNNQQTITYNFTLYLESQKHFQLNEIIFFFSTKKYFYFKTKWTQKAEKFK